MDGGGGGGSGGGGSSGGGSGGGGGGSGAGLGGGGVAGPQLLVYGALLQTKKPYLTSCVAVPALPVLLLTAQVRQPELGSEP